MEVLDQAGHTHRGVECREGTRPDDDPKDEAGDEKRGLGCVLEDSPVESAPKQGRDDATERADRSSFRNARESGEDRAEHAENEKNREDEPSQRHEPVPPAELFPHRRRRRGGGVKPATEQDVADEEGRQEEARQHPARIELADRDAGDKPVNDHRYARWDEDAERPTSGDAAEREPFRVAARQHGGERQQAHRHRCCCAHPRHRGKDRADHDGSDGEPAAEPAEEPVHGLIKILGNPRPLQ